MNYYFDTEFIEGMRKPLFGKPYHRIDLISIGIVAEDGRKYHAISNEFNPSSASKWVKDNVLYPIMRDNGFPKNLMNLHGCAGYSKSAIKNVQKVHGKSIKQIAHEILLFTNPQMNTKTGCYFDELLMAKDFWESHSLTEYAPDNTCPFFIFRTKPTFYAYYADYDWVVFCSLFGTMMELPKGFPMYCRDLQQTKEELAEALLSSGIGTHSTGDKVYPKDMKEALEWIKSHKEYPVNNNEHDAMADAEWAKQLKAFLKFYKNQHAL